jgi:hypothetical protein
MRNISVPGSMLKAQDINVECSMLNVQCSKEPGAAFEHSTLNDGVELEHGEARG